MIELKNEYKNLCRLKSYIDLADSPKFTRGPLFNEEGPASEKTAEPKPEHKQDMEGEPALDFSDESISH
ncbi:MAG: hypothetical protein K5770_12175 [Lachnospiraceae bacterium]|nr:hypothetical protein [Lachnospiraceae bacterium]